MRLQEIEARLAAIAADIETRGAQMTEEELDRLDKEVNDLKTERASLQNTENRRRDLLSSIAEGRTGRVQQQFAAPGEERREQQVTDPYDTPEYRDAFMRFARDRSPIPAELRATTATTDVQAVIPTTTLREFVKKLESYGGLYNQVRKLNIQGGVMVPILSLKPSASWIGESTPSTDQKLNAKDKISFTYFGLECKISQTLLANTVTFAEFQSQIIPLMTEAMNKALDIAIMNGTGSGQPLGVTVDARIPTKNVVTLSAADFAKWDGWKKKVFAVIPVAYRAGGNFYMAGGTFDGYIDGMVDTNGQPVARVNYGIADGPMQRFGGKPVELVEDDVVKPYDTAAAGDVVAVFMNPNDYAINTNMQLQITHWVDNDTNEVKDKAILIADGKLLDANGVIIIKKGATG